MARRQRAKIQAIAQELRYRREQPMAEQGKWLQSVLRGIHATKAAGLEKDESPRPTLAATA